MPMALHEQSQPPLVAVINTTEDIITLLCAALEDEGYATARAYVVDFRSGRQDITAFFDTYRPHAVIFDIAIPYDQNWRFFQEQVLGGGFLPHHKYVLMTTNLTALQQVVGNIEAFELMGKPFDLGDLLEAVQHVVQQ